MKRARGFTLLEMMIAMAILSGSLTWIIVGMSRNIRAENHAKLMATATFLARGQMVEIEDELYEKGFGDFEKELAGGFEDKGFARFSWKVLVDKTELPSSEALQTVLTKAQEAKQALAGGAGAGGLPELPPSAGLSKDAANNPLTMGASAMASQFGIIKDVLEQGIRRVTVQVMWTEGRRPEQVELIAYYTDVRKVDQAIQLPTLPAGAKP
jgi:prepilin-type N-terminal cleavage/methylation domain-containing protein